jgi:hypothetical protein
LDGERVVFCWVGTDDVPRDVIARVRKAVEDRLTMFVPVRHSWAELTALTDRLNSAAGQLRERGVTMTTWGPDVLSNRVVVTFDRYSQSAEEELRAAFPGEPLMVSAEGVVPDPAGRRTEYGPQ